MLIVEKLKSEHFSDSQQSVINYILEEKLNIQEMTIREIASACYTSNATLIRIAHKLGYSGWEEFKADYLKEQAYLSSHFSSIDPNIPFTKRDSFKSIMHKVAILKEEAIEDTKELLRLADVKEAVKLIDKADYVIITGLNNTSFLAENFALKLGRLTKRAAYYDPRGELMYNHELEKKGSLYICLSYSGETTALIERAKEAKRAKTPVIVITSIGESTLSKLADVVLPISTREKMYSKIGWFTSEAAFNYVLDVLYAGLFWLAYDKNIDLKFKTADHVEHYRQASSGILAESKKTQSTE